MIVILGIILVIVSLHRKAVHDNLVHVAQFLYIPGVDLKQYRNQTLRYLIAAHYVGSEWDKCWDTACRRGGERAWFESNLPKEVKLERVIRGIPYSPSKTLGGFEVYYSV